MRRMIDVQGTFKGPYREDGPELIPGFAEGYRVSWATTLGDTPLEEGDGVAVSGESSVTFEGGDAELLAFDLA